MKKAALILSVILLFCLAGCSGSSVDKPIIAVTIAPQAHFVEKICGEQVKTVTLIPAGASAETYEMKPKEILDFAEARLYFSIGVPAEEKGILPNIGKDTEAVALAERIGEVYPDLKIGSERDPHIWLSPKRAILAVEIMTEEICRIDPQNSELYKENSAKYIEDLRQLCEDITEVLKDRSGDTFLTYHPAYGYFAEDFSLKEISIEHNGKEATAKQLAGLITQAKEAGIKYVFCQEEASEKQAQLVAKEIGAQLKTLTPLAENYEEALLETARLIAMAVE